MSSKKFIFVQQFLYSNLNDNKEVIATLFLLLDCSRAFGCSAATFNFIAASVKIPHVVES